MSKSQKPSQTKPDPRYPLEYLDFLLRHGLVDRHMGMSHYHDHGIASTNTRGAVSLVWVPMGEPLPRIWYNRDEVDNLLSGKAEPQQRPLPYVSLLQEAARGDRHMDMHFYLPEGNTPDDTRGSVALVWGPKGEPLPKVWYNHDEVQEIARHGVDGTSITWDNQP